MKERTTVFIALFYYLLLFISFDFYESVSDFTAYVYTTGS